MIEGPDPGGPKTCGSGFGSGSATPLKWVRPVLRAGGGAGQDEGDDAAVRHHED